MHNFRRRKANSNCFNLAYVSVGKVVKILDHDLSQDVKVGHNQHGRAHEIETVELQKKVLSPMFW